MRLFGVKFENLSTGARVLHIHVATNLVISDGCQEEDRRDTFENRELKHERFWEADGNRKWAVVPFNLSSHNHNHIANYLFSITDDWSNIWETSLSWHAKCSLPVAVSVSKTRMLKLLTRTNVRGLQSFCFMAFSLPLPSSCASPLHKPQDRRSINRSLVISHISTWSYHFSKIFFSTLQLFCQTLAFQPNNAQSLWLRQIKL